MKGKVGEDSAVADERDDDRDKPILGMIATINKERAFGFIFVELGAMKGEYFFHKTALADGENWGSLRVGQTVSFIPVKSAKGPRAIEVRR